MGVWRSGWIWEFVDEWYVSVPDFVKIAQSEYRKIKRIEFIVW